MLVAEITAAHIECWRATLTTSARTRNKLLIELHGIFRRAQRLHGLRDNPAARVEPLRAPRRLDLQVFSPEEVRALVRAGADEQDAAIYLTAALRPAPRRAARAALARRRLRHQHPARQRVLRRPRGDLAQERQAPRRAAGYGSRDRNGAPWPARTLHRRACSAATCGGRA
jgi:hypothetical protein